MKTRTGPEEALRCSFCHKSQDAVAKLISSPSDYPRAKYPPRKTLYHRLFGSPLRAHRDNLIKLLAVVIVFLLSALLIRWLN